MKSCIPLLICVLALISCQGTPGVNAPCYASNELEQVSKAGSGINANSTGNLPTETENSQVENEKKIVIIAPYADLLARIRKAKPGDTIIVAAGTYNIDATDGLVLEGLENIVLKAAGEKTEFVSDSPFATIITIRNCKNLTFDGFTVYHRVDTACVAACISVEQSHSIVIRHCDIHGSGAYGVFVEEMPNSTKIDVLENSIHNCSYYGMEYHAESGRIAGNHFYANNGNDILIDGEYAAHITLEDNKQDTTESRSVNNAEVNTEYNRESNTDDNTEYSTEDNAQHDTDYTMEVNTEDDSSATIELSAYDIVGYWDYAPDGSQGGYTFGESAVQIEESMGGDGTWEYRDGTIYIDIDSELQDPGDGTPVTIKYSYILEILEFKENFMSVRVTNDNGYTFTTGLYKIVK